MKRAFTLVELLIVVGIIGILATIGVSAYSSTQVNSRNQKRKANLTQTAKALELYANDHGGLYPSTGGNDTAHLRGACSYWMWGPYPDSGAGAWIPGFSPEYMATLPTDTKTNTANRTGCQAQQTCYLYVSNGTDYYLRANCLPEGTLSASDPFYNGTSYSWDIYSPGAKTWFP